MIDVHELTALKSYLPVVLAALFGATAHALEEIKKVGWKGWASFIIDLVICSFVGYTFFHLALFVNPENPQYAVFATSIGSYWGTRGFRFVKQWFINGLKPFIK
jgi:hypothetical protein